MHWPFVCALTPVTNKLPGKNWGNKRTKDIIIIISFQFRSSSWMVSNICIEMKEKKLQSKVIMCSLSGTGLWRSGLVTRYLNTISPLTWLTCGVTTQSSFSCSRWLIRKLLTPIDLHKPNKRNRKKCWDDLNYLGGLLEKCHFQKRKWLVQIISVEQNTTKKHRKQHWNVVWQYYLKAWFRHSHTRKSFYNLNTLETPQCIKTPG